MGIRGRDGMMSGRGRKKKISTGFFTLQYILNVIFFKRKHVLIIYTWMWDSDIDW